jgi:transketolase
MQMTTKQSGLDPKLKVQLEKVALAIRQLTMDATQKANSGHPGLPMGCAEIGAYLWGHFLKYNPKNSHWINRDRFVLSGGHGSMLLYSVLHLSGYKVSLESIENFRQLHSGTPGHPEFGDTDGVETTTGPLGQGTGNGVGQALGLKMLASRFNTPEFAIIDAKVVVLMSDGDAMEGVSHEVSALAGHLKLDNLIFIYDANHISLDGPLMESCSEDTKLRYQGYGWDVHEIDGNDLQALHQTLSKLREKQTRPTLVITRTIIGKGAPNKAGTHQAHGSPLGSEEVHAAKEALGLPQTPFAVSEEVYAFFKSKLPQDQEIENGWNKQYKVWREKNPEHASLFDKMHNLPLPKNLEEELGAFSIKSPAATRKSSGDVIQFLSSRLEHLIGGSADLSSSDMTMMKGYSLVAPGCFQGRNIKFGVREFGMATIASGLSHLGFFTPFIGTFLVFSDYMRNAIRLASLMKAHVIYQFTHDSIFLGEDGPTHQPIEHLASLRAIPNLHVIRPADATEVKWAWLAALEYKGPTAIVLSRQNLPELQGAMIPYKEGVARGAYIVKKEKGKADFTLIATGSEVSLALDVAEKLESMGKSVRVISMPCTELFDLQPKDYKDKILGGDLGKRVSIEAGSAFGWHKYIGMDGITIAMESFGASAPAKDLAEFFGFTVESILERIL